MQGFLLVLLVVRLIFLLGAAGLCLYGCVGMGAPTQWRLAYGAGLAISLMMIWALWRSYRKLSKD